MHPSRLGYCCGRIYITGGMEEAGYFTVSCKDFPSTVESSLCKQRYISHTNKSTSHGAITRCGSEIQFTPVTVADCT